MITGFCSAVQRYVMQHTVWPTLPGSLPFFYKARKYRRVSLYNGKVDTHAPMHLNVRIQRGRMYLTCSMHYWWVFPCLACLIHAQASTRFSPAELGSRWVATAAMRRQNPKHLQTSKSFILGRPGPSHGCWWIPIYLNILCNCIPMT